MPRILFTALLSLGLLGPAGHASVCSKGMAAATTPAALANAIEAASHLSPAVRAGLLAVNRSLSSNPVKWQEFAGEVCAFLYPEPNLREAFKQSVARLESSPGLGAYFLKQTDSLLPNPAYQGALAEVGAGLVFLSFSSLKTNLNYVDTFFEAASAYLWAESDRTQWSGSFERLHAQATHYN